MNPEILKKLQAKAAQVRIGGKGTVRRKKKIVHAAAGPDEKKVAASLRQCGAVPVPDIQEANIIKSDGNVIHFNNPQLNAAMGSNMFVLYGRGDEKSIVDLLPGIFQQLDRNNLDKLQQVLLKNNANTEDIDDEEVPTLVNCFDAASNDEK